MAAFWDFYPKFISNKSQFLAPISTKYKEAIVFLTCRIEIVKVSDESEPSWLMPQLELKDFQLGWACDIFPFSQKRAEILLLLLFYFCLS